MVRKLRRITLKLAREGGSVEFALLLVGLPAENLEEQRAEVVGSIPTKVGQPLPTPDGHHTSADAAGHGTIDAVLVVLDAQLQWKGQHQYLQVLLNLEG